MKKFGTIILIALLLPGLFACNWSRKEKGTAIGAGAGAVIGGIIGDKAGNTAAGAIIGAVVGGVAGAYIGNYMDKQAEEIERDLKGARVERIGEGIKITFESGILFDVNRSDVKLEATNNLANLAGILNKYEDTEILIEGHTDATGSNDHNLTLSIRRAQSVTNYLAGLEVMSSRMNMMGYGEDQPVAANDTMKGRQLNRRVEIAIFANDKLKKVASEQVGG